MSYGYSAQQQKGNEGSDLKLVDGLFCHKHGENPIHLITSALYLIALVIHWKEHPSSLHWSNPSAKL